MNLSSQARRMIQVILIVNIAAAVISIIYYRSMESVPFLLGILIGGGASLARVFFLERTVNKIVSEENTNISPMINSLGRQFIAFIALLVGALVDGISLLGVIVGIFSYQIGTFFLHSTLTSDQKNQLDKSKSKTEEKSKNEEGR